MKLSGLRFFPFLFVPIVLMALPPVAPASADRNTREVRLNLVQGDVRLSRGDGKHPDLKKTWEAAQGGELIEQGFAVATGNGIAEIEFENGSTAYLAENSLLLFRELSSSGERIITGMVLPTGTATFWLQPANGESFSIETPTDRVQFPGPQTIFLRFDAYLDATAITPIGGKLQKLVRRGMPNLQIATEETVFFRRGAVLPSPHSPASLSPDDSIFSDSALVPQASATVELLRDSGMLPVSLAPQDFAGIEPAGGQTVSYLQSENVQSHLRGQGLVGRDWVESVEARVEEKNTTMAAALKASGLSSPVHGLADLYVHGNFFACEPYGTCWEPKNTEAAQESGAKPAPPNAQVPAPNPVNVGFQPQTVQWQESVWGLCDFSGSYRTITRVARTPEELNVLLRLKSLARSRANRRPGWIDASCYRQSWIYHRNHYAMVLPRPPRNCVGKGCGPVHPPRPLFVRVGDKVGFVPRHPDDLPGKQPINLKNGIILPPIKPGDTVQRIAWDPSQKLTFLDKPPKEFERELARHSAPAAAPQIRAHLMQEARPGYSLTAANHAIPPIMYDYRTQQFKMPAAAAGSAKGKEVAVAGIASNGKIESFASGGSGRYADSLGRSTAAASYSGGGNYGSHSSGSGSSGGSFGGSSSHSSGGGSVSSSGGSSSSSVSGGGRSH
jgi:hypothetical protein